VIELDREDALMVEAIRNGGEGGDVRLLLDVIDRLTKGNDAISFPAVRGGESWCTCGHRLGKHKTRWARPCIDPNCACTGFVEVP
jgi:hypothetical protein